MNANCVGCFHVGRPQSSYKRLEAGERRILSQPIEMCRTMKCCSEMVICRGFLFDSSDLQCLQIGDALLREFPALLDKIVLDPAYLRRPEGLHPIDGASAERDLRVPCPPSPNGRTVCRQ